MENNCFNSRYLFKFRHLETINPSSEKIVRHQFSALRNLPAPAHRGPQMVRQKFTEWAEWRLFESVKEVEWEQLYPLRTDISQQPTKSDPVVC